MRLADLAADLKIAAASGAAEITGLSADSRTVRPGYLFAALPGVASDGAAFIADAVRAGAVAVLVPPGVDVPAGVAAVVDDDPRRALAVMAARFFPRQPETLVAVTGTSGKTSVADFTRQIFAAAGRRAASIGTLGVIGPDGAHYGGLTTPDPVKLHETLDRLAGDGVTHAALEASSHGLDQRRLDGLRLTAAGFTNLGRDHMDYHPSVDDYLAAKLRLFREVLPAGRTAVVDVDGAVGEAVVSAAAESGRRPITVGRRGREIRILDAVPEGLAQRVALEVFGQRVDVLLPLAGTFQASNAAMALGLALSAGIPQDAAVAALGALRGAAGRLEKVAETPAGAPIFIDYAHKPEALVAALSALRPMTRGRLIAVIGAGGDRDPGKRPLMGEAAAAVADLVIVTDDNPRSEDPADIRAAIMAGAPGATEVPGRGEAIARAVAMLEAGDVLCIAGKGHETGQIVKGEVLPFSDHDAVAAALREVGG
ncbi:MAG: UDP-N-acetylmuramoyl-L-alanyl-D-glutamate--2,6-diaminopimelate ligase [Bauldia sp.]|nr:UDP-N-acetylmuramoyl-L-alanyl-D-glutamate--2,6-diaminopimelate ligase [Bauldia sp.]